jgi:hypothetical protein
MIGYYIDSNVQKASSRIRYLNIMRYLNKVDIELFNYENYNKYSIILFGKKFLDDDIKLAKTMKKKGKLIYFDLCDNYFYNPDNLESYHKYSNNIKEIMVIADKVILSSDELKKHVIKELPQIELKIVVIEDAYEEELIKKNKFIKRIKAKLIFIMYKFIFFNKKNINLVWFGNAKVNNASAGMLDLLKVKNYVEEANKNYKVSLIIISNNKDLYKRNISDWVVKTHYFKWSNDNFVDILRLQDAALIPIDINDFTQCKTNNRLVKSIMNNLDVIADEIPSYTEFSEYCFFNKWNKGFEEIANSKYNKENKMIRIKGAKKIIEEKYLINIMATKWERIFRINN